jgi:hypothetical protein
VSGAFQPDERGDILQVLGEDVASSTLEQRHLAGAEREQALEPRAIVHHVDRDVINVLLRKKLFRSQAGTSAGVNEESEQVGRCRHGRIIAQKRRDPAFRE